MQGLGHIRCDHCWESGQKLLCIMTLHGKVVKNEEFLLASYCIYSFTYQACDT